VLEAGGNAFYERRSRRARQIAEAAKPAQKEVAASKPGNEAAAPAALSFMADDKAADRIGTLIANQDRPVAAN